MAEEIRDIKSLFGLHARPSVPFQQYEDNLYFSDDKSGLEYLNKQRGLKPSTLQHFHVGMTETKEIAIPVFKDGELIDYKYRKIVEKEFRRHPGAETWVVNEPAFQYATEDKYIVCVEGEFDAMALFQLGFKSVVSTTGGAQAPTPWIKRIPDNVKIFICYDNDEPGQEAAQKLAERIGIHKCYNITFKDVKDANDFLLGGGTKAEFQKMLDTADKFQIKGILKINDVLESLKKNKVERVDTFSKRLTAHLDGGIPKAGVITISGKPKAGKSNLLMNMLLHHAKQGHPTLLISLENDLFFTVQRLCEILLQKPYKKFTDKDFNTLKNEFLEMPLYLDVSLGNWDIDRIEKVVDQMKSLYGIEFFGFDHLGYLSGDEVKDIDDVMRRTKMMSRNLNIVSYIVVHIRKMMNDDDYPTANDLRGSASMAQESNAVLFMVNTKGGQEISIDISRMSRSKLRIPIIFDGPSGSIADDMSRSVKHYDDEVEDPIPNIIERKEEYSGQLDVFNEI